MSLFSRRNLRGSGQVAAKKKPLPGVVGISKTGGGLAPKTVKGQKTLSGGLQNLGAAQPGVVGKTGALPLRTLETPRTLASLSGGLQGPGSFSFSGTPTSPISTGANQKLGITLPNGQVIRIGPNSLFTPQQGLQQPGLELQGLLDLLQGGTLGNGGPSNLLGIRG